MEVQWEIVLNILYGHIFRQDISCVKLGSQCPVSYLVEWIICIRIPTTRRIQLKWGQADQRLHIEAVICVVNDSPRWCKIVHTKCRRWDTLMPTVRQNQTTGLSGVEAWRGRVLHWKQTPTGILSGKYGGRNETQWPGRGGGGVSTCIFPSSLIFWHCLSLLGPFETKFIMYVDEQPRNSLWYMGEGRQGIDWNQARISDTIRK